MTNPEWSINFLQSCNNGKMEKKANARCVSITFRSNASENTGPFKFLMPCTENMEITYLGHRQGSGVHTSTHILERL